MIKRENLIQYIIIVTIVVVVPFFALSANQNNNSNSFLQNIYCSTLGKWFNDSYCTKLDVIGNSTNNPSTNSINSPQATLGVNNQVPNTNKSTPTSTSITQTNSTLSLNKTPNNTNPATSLKVNNQSLTTNNQNTSTSQTSQLLSNLSNFVTYDFLSRQAGSLGDSFGRSLSNLSTQLTALIPSTASISNWDSFFTTPSTRITAGTGLSWSGNTLSATGGAAGDFTLASWYATTTNGLAEGLNNLYYTDTRVNTYLNASTTLPKSYSNNTFTGNNIFNGNLTLSTLNGPLQANNGLVSATTSVGVLYGGTGANTFGQGWLYSDGGTSALQSSTSPTVAYITATSTTATSTFASTISTGANLYYDKVVAPTAPTATVSAVSGSPNGSYIYRVSYVTNNGETEVGSVSNTVNPSSKKVDLSNIPISPDSRVIARKIYRTLNGGSNLTVKLLTTINDNVTTTYTDNSTDGGLGALGKWTNTTAGIEYDGIYLASSESPYNTSLGYRAFNSLSGYDVTAIGRYVLELNSGVDNTGVGGYALTNNTSANYNTAVGTVTLQGITTGGENTAIGFSAGRYLTDGVSLNSTGNKSVLVGSNIRVLANGDTNEIVIGADATGLGSHSVLLGNNSTEKTALKGNIGIGTTSPYAKLSLVGTNVASTTFALYGFNSQTSPLMLVASTTGSATTTAFIIDSNGKVGIGSTTPSATLSLTGNMYLSGTATSTIEGNLDVRNTLHALTSYTGDLFFANNFSFTESQPINASTTQGLYLKNQNGNAVLSIDDTGNLSLTGDLCANGKECFGKSLNTLTNNLNTLASSTNLDNLYIQSTNQSLGDLQLEVLNIKSALTTVNTTLNTLSSSSTLISSIASSTLEYMSSSTAFTTLASSTINTITTTPSFIQSIAQSVLNLIQSTSNWVVGQITGTLAKFTRVESDSVKTNSLCVDDICLSKDQLKALLINSGGISTSSVPVQPSNVITPENNQEPKVIEQIISTSTPEIILPISTTTPNDLNQMTPVTELETSTLSIPTTLTEVLSSSPESIVNIDTNQSSEQPPALILEHTEVPRPVPQTSDGVLKSEGN